MTSCYRGCALLSGLAMAAGTASGGCDFASRPDQKGATSQGASAEPSTATIPTAAATEASVASTQSPLATLFVGAPEPGVVHIGQRPLEGHPITVSYPPGWQAPPSIDPDLGYGAGGWYLSGKEDHAKVWIDVMEPTASLPDNVVKLNTQRVGAVLEGFEPPVDGQLGASSLPAKIFQGRGKIMNRPAELWYALAEAEKAKKTVVVFVAVRSDVYPKLRGEVLSIVRSVKVNL